MAIKGERRLVFALSDHGSFGWISRKAGRTSPIFFSRLRSLPVRKASFLRTAGVGVWGPIAAGVVLVQPFPGPGARIQISPAPAAPPRWSRDGKLYYMQYEKLMAASFDPQTGSAGPPKVPFQTRIVAARYGFFQYDATVDGRFLVNSLTSAYSSPLTLITGWNSAPNSHE
jgi:hypothetical protein